jgi:hypothetical protein
VRGHRIPCPQKVTNIKK